MGLRQAPVHLHCSSQLMAQVTNSCRVLDVGSGGRRLAPHVMTTDVVTRAGVDVVADACKGLPFDSATFDLVVCTSVLEHVSSEQKALAELIRVVKPGGKLWIEVPFIYNFHVSAAGDTHDYRRWTQEGCKQLLPGHKLLDHGQNVGPATALRLIASEVLALPLYRERHQGAYYVGRCLLGWLLYPLSWLDKACMRSSMSHRVAGGFWLLWEKV